MVDTDYAGFLTMSLAIILFLSLAVDLCNLVSSADDRKLKGENYTIRCPAPDQDAAGVTLYTRREVQREVLYYSFDAGKSTVNEDYKKRVNVKPDGKTLTINILNLQLQDTGVYWCSCTIALVSNCKMTLDKGVYLLVNVPSAETASSTVKHSNGIHDFLIPVTALTAGSVLLLLLLLIGVWLIPKIKKNIKKKKEKKSSASGVYEVMKVPRGPGDSLETQQKTRFII